MKRGLALIAIGLLAVPAAHAAVASRIDAVTIYPGRLARVERLARIDIAPGAGTVVFGGLPAAVESGSVRVAVESGAVRIGAVEVATEPVGDSPRERERALREQIEALQAQRQDALDRVTAARTQITFIEGLARLPEGEGAAEALTAGEGADRWAALWQSIGEGSRAAHERVRTGEREAQRLQREIEVLQRKLQQLGRTREQAVNVTVPYGAEAGGEAVLRLSYRVHGPRWQPLYQTRLDTATERLELVRSARVTQATGEEWTDVRLSLSTAQPVRGERPEPATWWIDLAPEMRPAQKAERSAESMADLAAGVAQEAPAAPARTVGAEFAATYEIAGRVSVPAGNQPRELQIGTAELAADIGAQLFPQQDPRAWLTATSTWDGPGPLPGGRVTRFRDGAYVGSGVLQTWSPGEQRDLSFGLDPQVQVRFEPLRDEAGQSGWITTQTTLVRRYGLEVTNRHGRGLPVTALFRVPVPRNEAIQVESTFSAPPSRRDLDDRRGVHAWEFELAAGKSRRLELGYEVSYPEDRELSGM